MGVDIIFGTALLLAFITLMCCVAVGQQEAERRGYQRGQEDALKGIIKYKLVDDRKCVPIGE